MSEDCGVLDAYVLDMLNSRNSCLSASPRRMLCVPSAGEASKALTTPSQGRKDRNFWREMCIPSHLAFSSQTCKYHETCWPHQSQSKPPHVDSRRLTTDPHLKDEVTTVFGDRLRAAVAQEKLRPSSHRLSCTPQR